MASCKAAICSHSSDEAIQVQFVSSVLREFQELSHMRDSEGISTRALHRRMLNTYHNHLARFKSHRSCFCCFMKMPEKVLACGHALCDPCIKIFGHQSSSERNTYELLECLLCGIHHHDSVFRFVPPTAGIRLLTADGGGVRAVVGLMYLQHLDQALAPFGCLVRDYFDFVCGTSAGKANLFFQLSS